MKTFKRLLTMVLTVATIASPMTAFAKENDNVQSEEQGSIVQTAAIDASTRASLGKVLATGTATIHGTGTLTINLPSGNWWADFVAGIGYTPQSGVVNCSVRTPDGKTFSLGSISGTGSRTDSHEEAYAPAGNYTFYFMSTIPEYQVIAYIYD